MAVDDCTYDASDLQDLVVLDDLDIDTNSKRHHTTTTTYDDFYASPLCVPQDSLHTLDLYPNFLDDFISLTGTGIGTGTFLHEYSVDDTSNKRVSLKERSCNYLTKPTDVGLDDVFSEKGGTLTEAPVTPIQIEEEKNIARLKEYYSITFHGDLEVGAKKRRTSRSRRPGRRKDWFIGYQFRDRFADDRMKKRCSHCQTDRTPQWRMGPLGPKTLCNACGVRHKTGRLLPEYRPAASPTFDVGKHSNFHRKILKLKGINGWDIGRN